MTSTRTPTATELASREADGVHVALLWHRHEGFVSVVVDDTRTDEMFELVLSDTDNAMDVFNHPFAYASYRGLEVGGSRNEAAVPLAA
jgi:hypothetical protein